MRIHKWLCPACKYAFAQTLTEHPIFIGPGTKKCQSCGANFRDGSREWKELSRMEKVRFLLPIEVLLAAAICFTSGAAVLVALRVLVGVMLAGVAGIFCVLVGPYYAKWAWEIWQSNKRFRVSHPFDIEVNARRL